MWPFNNENKVSMLTHSVYPEIILSADECSYVGKLITRDGIVKETITGRGKNRRDCIKEAGKQLTKLASKYNKGKK